MQVDQATSSAGVPSLASSSVFAPPPQSATPAPASNGLDSSNDMSRLFAATGLAHQDAAQRSLKRKASEEHPEGISRAGSVNSSLAVSSASSHKLAESTLSRDPSPVESELPVPSFMQTSSPDRITPPTEDAPNADDGQATRRSARKAPVPTSFVSIDGSITFPTPASTDPSAPATPYATLASPDRYRASAFSPTKKDKSQKPPYSYAALIGQAINSKPNKRISLNDIYGYIIANYSYYKKEDAGWQNSIRHNLSLNECFVKSPRTPADQPGKGSLWCIVQGCEEQFANGGFVKRLGGKKTKATPKKAKGDGEAAATGQASDAETTASGTSVKEPPVAPPPPKSPSKRGKKAAKKAPPPKTPVASDGETESPSSPVKDEEDDDYEAEGPVAPVRAVRRSRRHSKATAPEPAPKSDPEPEPSDSDDDSERTLLDNKPSPFGPFSGSRAGWQDDILRRDREAPQDASGPSPWTRKKLASSHRRGASFQDMSNDFLRSPSNTRMSALTTAASVLSPSNPPFPFMPSASPSNLLQSPEIGTTHIFSQGSPYLGAASLLSAAAAHHTQSPVSSMRSAFEERPGSPPSPGDHLSTKARNRAESSPAAPGSLIGSPEQQRWAGPNARRLSFEGTDNAAARSHDGALAASRALQFLQRDGPRGLHIEGVPSQAHANGSAPDEGEKGGVCENGA